MKDAAEITACVVDRGTFFPVAERLARGVKRLIYHNPSSESPETIARDCVGHGHPDMETVRDFWPIKKEIDLFVFPDCRDWGLQLELESQGFPVWGSKRGEELEVYRGFWLQVAKQIGLPMPHTEVLLGLEALREHLGEHRDEKKHIKISRYRGDMETWAAENWMVTRTKLDGLAHQWGADQDQITFYVQDDLDTDIEGGADTYFVGDQSPDELILGYEKKDQGYFGAVMSKDDMPPEIWKPSKLLAPLLAGYNYCNFFSSEVRVVDGESYLLDPCCRCPSPAGEEELEMLTNLPEIIWLGANGQLVQPDWAAKYCGGSSIEWSGDEDAAKSLRVPEEVRQWVKLYGCSHHAGSFHFAPKAKTTLGWVIGIGDTPGEMIDHLKEVREQFKGQPVELKIDPLVDLIAQINQAREMGMEFGQGEEMPEPAAVLDT